MSATLLVTGAGALYAETATAATGGVDVAGWCMSPSRGIYGALSTGARATNPSNAFSWECTTKNWLGQTTRQSGVDMNAACAWKYRGRGDARLANKYNAYSWYCVF